jgi:hypothetical protein
MRSLFGDQNLLGRVVVVKEIDATEVQFTYEDGRVIRVYAEDSEGNVAWLHTYAPESPLDRSIAASEEAEGHDVDDVDDLDDLPD